MRPDPRTPLAAAARRHELTRAKAIRALRELDRAGSPFSFASVAAAAGISRSWLYTQPDIRDQIRRLRDATRPAPGPVIPSASEPATRRCAPGSPPRSSATGRWRRRTPGCGASSPAHSATTAHPAANPVTTGPAETGAITLRWSRFPVPTGLGPPLDADGLLEAGRLRTLS
jgi:hypothetical protein